MARDLGRIRCLLHLDASTTDQDDCRAQCVEQLEFLASLFCHLTHDHAFVLRLFTQESEHGRSYFP